MRLLPSSESGTQLFPALIDILMLEDRESPVEPTNLCQDVISVQTNLNCESNKISISF